MFNQSNQNFNQSNQKLTIMDLMKKAARMAGMGSAAVAAALVTLCMVSCEEQIVREPETEVGQGVISLSITPKTKATGASHGIQSDDNTINTLEVFIFKNEGADAGALDSYKKFNSNELSSLSGIKLQCVAGSKQIWVIANSHKDDWSGISTLEQFKGVMASLVKEDLKSFSMSGSAVAQVKGETDVDVEISRCVARVHLSGIRTDFAGTPYEGQRLENVKAYLINAVGEVAFSTGAGVVQGAVLNYRMLVQKDVESCALEGMLHDNIAQEIGDEGYSTSHYFYCYENMLEAEDARNRFTKLVVQADLNGTTYYYPVSINREGFGYDSANGHAGVRRNTSYSVELVIRRPGTSDPDSLLEFGAVSANVSIMDWNTVPEIDVEF